MKCFKTKEQTKQWKDRQRESEPFLAFYEGRWALAQFDVECGELYTIYFPDSLLVGCKAQIEDVFCWMELPEEPKDYRGPYEDNR